MEEAAGGEGGGHCCGGRVCVMVSGGLGEVLR